MELAVDRDQDAVGDVGPRDADELRPVGSRLEGTGEHGVATGDARQPLGLLLVRPELGDRERRGHGREEGHGRHDPALLLEDEAQLDHTEATAAVRFRKADPEQLGLRQVDPQLAVEALLAGLDRFDPLHGRATLEDLLGQAAHRRLAVVEGEVHQPTGRKTGRVSSSSKRSNSTSTGMPTLMSAGSMPTMSETRRVPSSSSTRPTGSG